MYVLCIIATNVWCNKMNIYNMLKLRLIILCGLCWKFQKILMA